MAVSTDGVGAPPGRGRRAAGSGTRDRILDAARAEFAERGYLAASVRAISRRAAVDPALVRHYFGAKSNLFAAANDIPAQPERLIAAVLAAPPSSAASTWCAPSWPSGTTPWGASACGP